MHDKYIQDISKSYVDQILAVDPDNPQALIISVYLSEKQKWENKLKTIQAHKKTILDRIDELELLVKTKITDFSTLENKAYNETFFWEKIVNIFGIKTKTQRKIIKLDIEINKIQEELDKLYIEFDNATEIYNNIYMNPPDTTQYELAMIGNTLLRPR